MHTLVQSRIPGKLYLAGEYAILSPQQTAILMAVDAYIETSVQKDTQFRLYSEGVQPSKIETTNLKTIKEPQWQLVTSAIKIVQLLTGITSPFQLTIKSQMQSQAGLKYGFGSSGAVTASIIACLYLFYTGQVLTPLQLYKATVLAQLRIGASGSFGDVACSCYGGLVYYCAPDLKWLKRRLKSFPLEEVFELVWHDLKIVGLDTDSNYSFLIGWTGQPSSTPLKIETLFKKIKDHPETYQDFLNDSRLVVDQLKSALSQRQPALIHEALANYRHLLEIFDGAYQIGIITPQLDQLIHLAETFGYTAKSSGAGGGDCGIAFNHHNENKQGVHQLWKEAGIQPIDLVFGYPSTTYLERG